MSFTRTRPPGRLRYARWAAGLVALALVTGCQIGGEPEVGPELTGTLDPGAATLPEFDQIGVSEHLAAPASAVDLVSALGSTDSAGYLIVATEELASGRTEVGLWLSGDGAAWEKIDLGLDQAMSYRDIAVGTDGNRTVIAASKVSDNHRRRMVAFESTDRRTWTKLEVPATVDERGLLPQAVTIDGDSTYILGTDGGYTPTALIINETSRIIQLPKPSEGEDFGAFAGAAMLDGQIVALGKIQTPGDDPAPVSYVSKDHGLSWEGPTEDFGAARGFITGVIPAQGGLLASGAASSKDAWSPAVWFSADGIKWIEEDVSQSWDGGFQFIWAEGSTDAYFNSIAHANGQFMATVTNTNSKATSVFSRSTGMWSFYGGTDNWVGREVISAVMIGNDGAVKVVRNIRSLIEAGTLTPSKWTANQAFGTERGPMTVSGMVVNASDRVDLLGSEQVFQFTAPDSYEWAEVGSPWSASVEGIGPAVETALDPADSKALESRSTDIDPDSGAQVLAGSDFRAMGGSDASDAFTWFRRSSTEQWTQGSGLIGPNTEYVYNVRRVGSRWVVVGADNRSGEYTTDGYAAVWLSDDGVSWTRAQLPFDEEAEKRSEARDACELPNGDLLVVGSAKQGTSGKKPLAWHLGADGNWEQVDTTAFGEGGGGIASCAGSTAGAVLQGDLMGRATLWKTTDAKKFEQVRIGERGETYGKLIPLTGGGYAAPGVIDRAGNFGAVIWMSRDGENWFDVALPTSAPLLNGALADRNGQIIAAAGSRAGWQLWLLKNPYDIIA